MLACLFNFHSCSAGSNKHIWSLNKLKPHTIVNPPAYFLAANCTTPAKFAYRDAQTNPRQEAALRIDDI